MKKDGVKELTTYALWDSFAAKNPVYKAYKTPESFFFWDNETDANQCAELVVNGIKKATATSLWWFEKNESKLPQTGDLSIVTDWYGNAMAIIKTTKVEQIPYNKITAKFAEIEGEGDKSLAYWKKVHKAYYTREMKAYNKHFDERMIIVCEHFKSVFTR